MFKRKSFDHILEQSGLTCSVNQFRGSSIKVIRINSVSCCNAANLGFGFDQNSISCLFYVRGPLARGSSLGVVVVARTRADYWIGLFQIKACA